MCSLVPPQTGARESGGNCPTPAPLRYASGVGRGGEGRAVQSQNSSSHSQERLAGFIPLLLQQPPAGPLAAGPPGNAWYPAGTIRPWTQLLLSY